MSADSTQPQGQPLSKDVQATSYMNRIQGFSTQISQNKQQLKMLNFLNYATKECFPENVE